MPRSKFFVVCNFWSINSQWFSKWVEKVDTTSLYYFDFKIFQNDSEKISPIRNSGVMINWFSATAWKLRPNTTLHLLKVSRRVKFLFFKKPYIVKFVSQVSVLQITLKYTRNNFIIEVFQGICGLSEISESACMISVVHEISLH